MKSRLLFTAVFLMLACCATFGAGTEMDITLEGPWILYPARIPTDGTGGTPVLIAAAPSANDSANNTIYHTPMVSAGDGYMIPQNGLFCLTFVIVCAKDTSGKFTPDSGYFAPHLLPVTFRDPAKGWDPYQLGSSAYVLILPMPDTYSNDGMWNMQFYSDFFKTNTHVGLFTIGVRLHYKNGPDSLDLVNCDKFDISNCKSPVKVDPGRHTNLINTGLIRIAMKVPDSDEEDDPACDYHVRSIYHPMLYLIDSRKFKKGNQNQDYGFVDPATGFNANGSVQYDPDCHLNGNDDQQDDAPKIDVQRKKASSTARGMSAHAAQARSFVVAFRTAVDSASQLLGSHSEIISKINKDDTFLEHKSRDTDPSDFPRLSQLDRLASELYLASKKVKATKKNGSSKNARQLIKAADGVVGSKNGADCRAPIMLLPPQS